MSRLQIPRHAERFTAHDLLRAATSLGCDDVKMRTIRTFEELGLLDHPRHPSAGYGGGSLQGWWPRAQFDLWCTLLRHRKQLIEREGAKHRLHATLCNIVVA